MSTSETSFICPIPCATLSTKLLEQLQKPFTTEGHQVYLGASIGIAIYPRHGTHRDELVKNADTAMYGAKNDGRNSYQFYTRELTEHIVDRLLMEAELR